MNVATVLKVSLQSQKCHNSLKDVTEHQILCPKELKDVITILKNVTNVVKCYMS